ncbi:MAG: hypothetical protein FWD65_08165 [Coriobacteriia bacterium]|nr:hypothetical protein [Coriobacteriia bacterium]
MSQQPETPQPPYQQPQPFYPQQPPVVPQQPCPQQPVQAPYSQPQPYPQPLQQQPQPYPQQQPAKKGWGAGKIVALVLSILFVVGLATCGIGYAAYTSHQRAVENERKAAAAAAEKARLAEIDRNVEVFKDDMTEFLGRTPTSQQRGLNVNATGEVGDFEAFFNKQLRDYLAAVGKHDSAAVTYQNSAASLSAIAKDSSLATAKSNLATARKSSADFYAAARVFFDKKTFADQLKDSTLPATAKSAVLDTAAQYTTRFDAALTQAQKDENASLDAHKKLLDLLAAHRGSWKVKGHSLEWYSRSYFNQAEKFSSAQVKSLEKALDALWVAGGVKMSRTSLIS